MAGSRKVFRLIVFIFGIAQVHTSRILLIPLDHYSQVNAVAMLGKALKNAGHDVWMLANQRHEKIIHQAGLNTILTNPSEEAQPMVQTVDVQEKLWQGIFDKTFLSIMTKACIQNCREILGDDKLMNRMTEINFDLAVIDHFPATECSYLVPYYLAIPYVSFSGQPKGDWLQGLSSLPSVEPIPAFPFTNDMTFIQRVLNSIFNVGYVSFKKLHMFSMSEEETQKYIPNRSLISSYELSRNTLLTFVNFDPVCFDYPRVSAPNYHYIGGASAQPVQPLTTDLLTFIDGASEGVIIMTFGSIPSLASMPSHLLLKFMEGFKNLKQKVIMRQDKYEIQDVPNNVKLVRWVPQNDVLGHPNTKLFITHGGNNGQMEALYHGVPMLIFPMFADQEYAAIRAVHKGFGKTLDLQTFTSALLYETIQELVTNTTYQLNIKQCSEITKSLPSAGSTAVFWIEHVLKFGGEHLRPPGMDMPLWKFLCIDVILFLEFVCVCIVILGCCCCYCLLRCFGKCKRQPKKKKE